MTIGSATVIARGNVTTRPAIMTAETVPTSVPKDASGWVSVTAFVPSHVTLRLATMRGETVTNVPLAVCYWVLEMATATPPVITLPATMTEATVRIVHLAARTQTLETASVQASA